MGAAGDHGEIFLILVLSPPSPSVTLTIRSPPVDEQVGRDRRGKDERANVAGDRGGGGGGRAAVEHGEIFVFSPHSPSIALTIRSTPVDKQVERDG